MIAGQGPVIKVDEGLRGIRFVNDPDLSLLGEGGLMHATDLILAIHEISISP